MELVAGWAGRHVVEVRVIRPDPGVITRLAAM